MDTRETAVFEPLVRRTEAGNWVATTWVDGDPWSRYFPTEDEAWAWVRQQVAS